MDVEPLRLEAGEAVGDRLEPLPHRVQVIKPFPQAEVGEVVRTQLIANVRRRSMKLRQHSICAIA